MEEKQEYDVRKGKLIEFHGSQMSWLAFIDIDDEELGLTQVTCENVPTVLALEACFGNVIENAHTVNTNPGFKNKTVYYSTDANGILDGFTPIREASKELRAAYHASKKRRGN